MKNRATLKSVYGASLNAASSSSDRFFSGLILGFNVVRDMASVPSAMKPITRVAQPNPS